jgi:hypothetical protein
MRPRSTLRDKTQVTTKTRVPRPWLRALLLSALGLLAACGSFEEKRIRELLHEKGFGSRATGDAMRENYMGGLDAVQFLLPPTAALQPGAERLAELTVAQRPALDGTIFVPYVGPLYVLGKTETELAALVRASLRSVFAFDIDLQARIISSGKVFYAIGEVGRKGRVLLEPDLTLIDAMFLVNWTNLANLGRIYLIRPDAENPLVVDVNFREMITTGNTRPNIQLRERDIVYVPPTFLGFIARFLERILEPVGLAVFTMLGFANVQSAYDYLSGESDYYFRF